MRVCFFNYVCALQTEHQTLRTLRLTVLNMKAAETH